MRDFVATMPRELRVRPIVFDRNSEVFPGLPALLHLSAYYMAEKGGLQGYSFAMYPTSVIRYAPSTSPGMAGGAEWHPEWFRTTELVNYDCVLVHARGEQAASLFNGSSEEVTLAFHEGDWRGYRVKQKRVGFMRFETTTRHL